MHRIKQFIIAISLVLVTGTPLLAPAPVMALSQASQDACNAINAGSDCTDASNGSLSLTGVIGAVVKILAMIVGAAATIMLIIAGMKYVTSGGDTGAVASAKNMIIYSLVGIVVAASAFYLVGYVVHAVGSAK